MSQRGSQKKRKKEKGGSESQFDPDQDPEERQLARKTVRQITEDAEVNTGAESQLGFLERLDSNYKNVKNTRDAVADANALNKVTRNFTKDLVANTSGKVPWDNHGTLTTKLITKLITHASGDHSNRAVPKTRDAWNGIGMIAQKFLRTAPIPQFMLGPLSMDTTKKVRQQGQRREKVDFSKATKASTAVDPDLEKKQDFSDRLVRELTALITEVDRSSEGDLSQAPNLFKLCVHPKSFSQTVENFFHLSFVVKQGLAQIANHEGEPVVIATEKASGKQEKSENPEQHIIFELNMQDWHDAVELYNIKKPMIEDRPASTVVM